MPILNVKVSRAASPELTRHIAELLMAHTTRILKKARAVTAIAIGFNAAAFPPKTPAMPAWPRCCAAAGRRPCRAGCLTA